MRRTTARGALSGLRERKARCGQLVPTKVLPGTRVSLASQPLAVDEVGEGCDLVGGVRVRVVQSDSKAWWQPRMPCNRVRATHAFQQEQVLR